MVIMVNSVTIDDFYPFGNGTNDVTNSTSQLSLPDIHNLEGFTSPANAYFVSTPHVLLQSITLLKNIQIF